MKDDTNTYLTLRSIQKGHILALLKYVIPIHKFLKEFFISIDLV